MLVCVVNDEQVMAVLNGPGGVFESAPSGLIVAIHSTILPETVETLARIASEIGVSVVDAPVSGSAKGARDKTMFYMIGGSADAVSRCRPVFAVSGSSMTLTGGVGSATVANAPDGGAVFTLHLPVVPATGDDEGPTDWACEPAAPRAPAARR